MDIIENIIEDTDSRITAVVNETTGDLRGSNTRAAYTIEVTNEFEVAKTFTLSIQETSKFVITNAAGNTPTYTIAGKPANGSPIVQTYTFYIEKAPGAQYASSPQRITVLFQSSDSTNEFNAGRVYAQVDVDTQLLDSDPPVISNVKIEEVVESDVNDPIRRVKVSWDSSDESSAEQYQ